MARGFRAPALGGGWISRERGNEMVGRWAGRKEKKGKEGKEQNGRRENRKLVGLERFVKIPQATYKLHRS